MGRLMLFPGPGFSPGPIFARGRILPRPLIALRCPYALLRRETSFMNLNNTRPSKNSNIWAYPPNKCPISKNYWSRPQRHNNSLYFFLIFKSNILSGYLKRNSRKLRTKNTILRWLGVRPSRFYCDIFPINRPFIVIGYPSIIVSLRLTKKKTPLNSD